MHLASLLFQNNNNMENASSITFVSK